MTSTAATTAPASPIATNGLPPALPAGGSTGGGAAAAATTQPATAGTATSYVATTNAVGGGYQSIPAPGSCTMPPPVQQTPPKTSGGGPVDGAALAPVLQQLTAVIGQLGTLVGGISGGGAASKTPEQAPAKPAKDASMGGGPAPATPAAPASSTVAGANGAPAANAAHGAHVVQGGHSAASMDALVKALQGVIETLTSLIASLGGRVEGGGPGTPTQMPPSDVKGDHGPGGKPMPTHLPPTEVKGDSGPGKPPAAKPLPPVVEPPKVGGSHGGPEQSPVQVPVPAKPATSVAGSSGGAVKQTPPPQPKPTPPAVGGASGGPVQQTPPSQPKPAAPTVAGASGGPVQQTPPKPTPPAVAGANGGPVQQTPTQVGGAGGGPAPAKPVVTKGNVVLDNDDDRWSAKLVAAGGKAEHSVELWGDPHVVITVDGKAERFDIGYGAGKVTLFDGTMITWDTYGKGEKNQFILRDFQVDSAGTELDRSVTTRDRNGNAGDQMGLTTALTDAHLKEFATALRTMQGPMSDPLKNGSWTSPGQASPGQKPAA